MIRGLVCIHLAHINSWAIVHNTRLCNSSVVYAYTVQIQNFSEKMRR